VVELNWIQSNLLLENRNEETQSPETMGFVCSIIEVVEACSEEFGQVFDFLDIGVPLIAGDEVHVETPHGKPTLPNKMQQRASNALSFLAQPVDCHPQISNELSHECSNHLQYQGTVKNISAIGIAFVFNAERKAVHCNLLEMFISNSASARFGGK
jgi:hypothetical protein